MATLRVGMELDQSGLKKGLKGAEKETANFAKNASDSMRSMMKGALVGIASYLAIGKLVDTFKDVTNLAMIQEKAVQSVKSALEATGHAAGYTSKELAAMASEFQNNSTFGDESIMQDGMTTLLKFKNVRGEVFQEGMQSILDLSAQSGKSIKEVSNMMGKALQDPIQGMSALKEIGAGLNVDQQELLKTYMSQGDVVSAQKLLLENVQSMSKGAAESMSRTRQGELDQLKNATGDLKEEIGFVLLKIVEASPLLQIVLEKVKLVTSWIHDNASLIAATVQIFFVNLYYSLLKFRQYGENFFVNVILSVMNIYEVAKGIFVFLWDTLKNVFSYLWDSAMLTVNVFKNLGKAIWDAITGKGVNIKSVVEEYAAEVEKIKSKKIMGEFNVNTVGLIAADSGIAALEESQNKITEAIMEGANAAQAAIEEGNKKEEEAVKLAADLPFEISQKLPEAQQKAIEKTTKEDNTKEEKISFIDMMSRGSKEAYQAINKAIAIPNQNKSLEEIGRTQVQELRSVNESVNNCTNAIYKNSSVIVEEVKL